jgi:uridine kinase
MRMRHDSHGLMRVQALLIAGTIADGKSTVAAEINDALAALKVPNAAIDLDALIWQWPSSSEWNNDLMFENLGALWPNYLARGATHLVLARVLEDASELER